MSKWISVKDRMPETYDDVLILDAFNNMFTGYYEHQEWHDNYGCAADDVTHWMPLPEPPEATDDD